MNENSEIKMVIHTRSKSKSTVFPQRESRLPFPLRNTRNFALLESDFISTSVSCLICLSN